ncbi:MAG TPA: hypothetical protein VF630_13430 [Hymenobacter sp.]|jgi:hypothetical protein
MRYFFTFPALARLSVAATVGLAGCTGKEGAEPAEPCATTATVRLCRGNNVFCLTEATLELADGTRLWPTGPVWEAYKPQQVDGQVLRISYQNATRPANSEAGPTGVTLSCLEAASVVDWCGTR